MNLVIRLRNYRRLPGYFTPDTIRDRELLRAIGWTGGTLISEGAMDTLLGAVSKAGCWLSTAALRDDYS